MTTTEVSAQNPKRKAFIGIWGKADSLGLVADTVVPGSTSGLAGIKKYDRIVHINNKAISSLYDYSAIASGIRENDPVVFDIIPKGKSKHKIISGKAIPRPLEKNPYAEIKYEWITTNDCHSRMLLYLPRTAAPPPVILFIPGYNCGSIENFSANYNGKIRDAWLQAGYAVACVEKSGVGDSYNCKPCVEATLTDDIAIYSKTYEYLQTLQSINKDKIILWGHSMGGVIAPLLAEKYHPAGVMVFATVYRPWNEFLLEMHRVQAPLDGKSYTETETFVRTMHQIYYEFFILKKSPEEINRNDALKPLMASEMDYKPGSTLQWGRHWRFWQQIDSVNLAKAWSNVSCPVLSIFGGSDFIQCSPFEHELICETVNKTHPGQATHITIPNLDHLMVPSETRAEAHEHFKDPNYIATHFNPKIAEATLAWLERFKV